MSSFVKFLDQKDAKTIGQPLPCAICVGFLYDYS
jgi:hypothetical protein